MIKTALTQRCQWNRRFFCIFDYLRKIESICEPQVWPELFSDYIKLTCSYVTSQNASVYMALSKLIDWLWQVVYPTTVRPHLVRGCGSWSAWVCGSPRCRSQQQQGHGPVMDHQGRDKQAYNYRLTNCCAFLGWLLVCREKIALDRPPSPPRFKKGSGGPWSMQINGLISF